MKNYLYLILLAAVAGCDPVGPLRILILICNMTKHTTKLLARIALLVIFTALFVIGYIYIPDFSLFSDPR